MYKIQDHVYMDAQPHACGHRAICMWIQGYLHVDTGLSACGYTQSHACGGRSHLLTFTEIKINVKTIKAEYQISLYLILEISDLSEFGAV